MSPFTECIKKVEDWLPSTGFTRVIGKKRSWEVSPTIGYLKGETVTLVLPETFPAHPVELYLDPKYFLALPHVESDGQVCLNVPPIPEDYENPIAAVCRTLKSFDKDWFPSTTGAISHEFHKERLAYWGQYQEKERKKLHRWQLPANTFVELSSFQGWVEGDAVRYIQKGHRGKQSSCQVATAKQDGDAAVLANRHGFDVGTLVKGKALFIQLPLGVLWTPRTWPRNFEALSALVDASTARQIDLRKWVLKAQQVSPKTEVGTQSKKFRQNLALMRERPLLVFFVQEQALFGYQILPSQKTSSSQILTAPLSPKRIDAAWALTRDHEVQKLEYKQEKHVLVIGCGSLGSPIIELLARSGVGHLDILDKEKFEVPNVSRHMLGIRAINAYKAKALASRLVQEIPGIRVRSITGDLASWLAGLEQPEKYDLVIECTGESSVRTLVSQWRSQAFGDTPVVHAWLEPFCSAAHVVLTQASDPWPWEDPADAKINIANFAGTNHKVMLPACNSGFYPYGPTDVWGAASFVAERTLAVLEEPSVGSMVWSWVRTKAFYESLPVCPVIHDENVLATGDKLDKKTVERDYYALLGIHQPAYAKLVAV